MVSMKYVADLHLHSRYSRAVSSQMTLPVMADYATKKGINILTTGDFTHPLWFREITTQLKESGEGVYQVKGNQSLNYILTVEVSCIYSQGGKARRIHCLIFAPDIQAAEKINQELIKRGANLSSDGRPIIGLSAKQLLEIILEVDERCILIPCHAWTPWFSLYGSMSGFDSIEECFKDLSDRIYGIETGLSSDPLMNWRISELDNRSILSFSDSHSPMKMGREATVFDLTEVSFPSISEAIKNPFFGKKTNNRISATFEFYPEEGKYHFTGHRNCGVIQSPEETRRDGLICPKCKKPLTIGVMHRVEDLAKRGEEFGTMVDDFGVHWTTDPKKNHPPYAKLVPLIEIIAETTGMTPISQKVREIYEKLCLEFDTEIQVLLKTRISEIEKIVGDSIALGVEKVRSGQIEVRPGYDGEYGIVHIDLGKNEEKIPADSQIAIDF